MSSKTGPRPPETETGLAPDSEWVIIAKLLRTRGRRGELSAISLSSHPERFENLREVTLFGAEGSPNAPLSCVVEETWEHGARLIFKFEGVDTISDAERLRGAEVRLPHDERFGLPEGEFYHSDLVGCEVVDRASGTSVGTVAEFLEMGGNGLLKVLNERDGEVLVPFRKEIVPVIDLDAKRIEVELPEGLLELNQR